MKDEKDSVAQAIIQAAHIISNLGAGSPSGTQYGGLEAHGMNVARSINNLAEAVEGVAFQMERIASALDYRNIIEDEKKHDA